MRCAEINAMDSNLDVRSSRSGAIIVFGATVFLSALLLFQVQPLIGKYILPWFGGSPAVWTTCMLVFQTLLFAGYAYAHWLSGLRPKVQASVHLALLSLAVLMLPIGPGPQWKPIDGQSPTLRIMLLLTACVGVPYFALSATGPLLQHWFTGLRKPPGSGGGFSVYRLYALSNLGSLLALITYPFLVEPWLSVHDQSRFWSIAFMAFAVLCASAIALMMSRPAASPDDRSNQPLVVDDNDGLPPGSASQASPGLWFLLSMTPSIMLLASTNQVCLDVAVVPFLWILPLALYLITFILCFESSRWYRREAYLMVAIGLQVASVLLMTRGSAVPLMLQVVIYFGGFFATSMVCHGELARMKPEPSKLTMFYLILSAGGACGGLFVGLVAPSIFIGFYELYMAIFCFMIGYLCIRVREDRSMQAAPRWLGPTFVSIALAGVVLGCMQIGRHQTGTLCVARNFYGVLRVEQVHKPEESDGPLLQLAHGRIAHGSQFLDPHRCLQPTAYYAENTGIGRFLSASPSDAPRRIGIIGLGIGTLAAYGRDQDVFRMYEINPDVVRLARQHFTFLDRTASEIQIITGDGRLSLEYESPQAFDLLVLDAFSGDAIPLHLLTREAMAVYQRHLKQGGVIAIHISNLHFNLRPVITGLAEDQKLHHRFLASQADPSRAARAAVWAFLSDNAAALGSVEQAAEPADNTATKPVLWTDAKNNLLDVLW